MLVVFILIPFKCFSPVNTADLSGTLRFSCSSCSAQTLGHFTFSKIQLLLAETAIFHSFTRTQKTCSSSRAPISPFLNARLRFSCLAARAKSSGCFALSIETKSVSFERAPTPCGFKRARSAFRSMYRFRWFLFETCLSYRN